MKRKIRRKTKITSSLLFAAMALAFIGCSGGGGNGSSTSNNPLPDFPTMPSAAEETPVINQTLGDFRQALESKDVAGAGELFAPEVRTNMEAWLDAHQDLMPKLAEVLTSMPLSSLSDEYGWAEEGDRRRSAEVSVEDDGITFYIRLEKVDGDWKILSF